MSFSDFDIRARDPAELTNGHPGNAGAKSVDEQAAVTASDVTYFITHVAHRLTTEQAQRVLAALDRFGFVEGAGFRHIDDNDNPIVYDESYDLKDEISRQITAVRALQNMVITNGRVVDGVSAREVKDTVATANSMIGTLMRHHEELMSMDRRRAIEQSTVEVLQEMGGGELVDRFVTLMEERLKYSS